MRLNCRDETLELMSDPLLWEDISFAEPLPPPGVWRPSPPLRFDISAARIDANEKVYYDELRREGAKEEEARAVAGGAAHGLSGVALWPRLVLDPKGDIVVESRGPRGEAQKSHWQTVLALLAPRPVPVAAGSVLQLEATVKLGAAVDVPPVYELQARVA